MKTQEIWHQYGQELYFFILKNVKNKNTAQDILQNSFLKVHKNIQQLREGQKLRAWLYQICRNEINNHFNKEKTYKNTLEQSITAAPMNTHRDVCCFDKFIDALPYSYRAVIELVYIAGKKQEEAAETLNISLANVKARIRRSKALLKRNFQDCCKYKIDSKGNLTGTPNCISCS